MDYDLCVQQGRDFPNGQQVHRVKGEPEFVNPAGHDYRLKPGSAGTGAAGDAFGVAVQGDDVGASLPCTRKYGIPYRPLPVATSVNRLHFEAQNARNEWLPQTFTLASSEPKFRGEFIIQQPDDMFFRVEPSHGTLLADRPFTDAGPVPDALPA